MDSGTNTELFQKLLFLLLVVMGGALAVTQGYQIPKLKKENKELREIKETITTVYIPGKVDSILVKDTVWVETSSDKPVNTSSNDSVFTWTTQVNDSFLQGKITTVVLGPSKVLENSFSYSLINPIYSFTRVDTIKVTSIRSIPVYRNAPRNYRLQAGIAVGGGLQEQLYNTENGYETTTKFSPSFGPSLVLLTPSDHSFGYKYDIADKKH
jgi:hypothetical protein